MSDGFPVGAVIAFPGNAGPPSNLFWALCDGANQGINGAYAELFNVIGYSCGGGGASFNLPDYRGRFLRGADDGASNDPNANERTAMNPGGNTGDALGSIQGYATGVPNQSFQAKLSHLPTVSKDIAATAVGHDVAAWNSGSVNLTFQGGDQETRPLNLYVDYYIKYSKAE